MLYSGKDVHRNELIVEVRRLLLNYSNIWGQSKATFYWRAMNLTPMGRKGVWLAERNPRVRLANISL